MNKSTSWNDGSCSLILNSPRLYQDCVSYLMTLIWEVYILFVSIYIFVIEFTDQSTEDKKTSKLKPFMVCMMTVSSIVSVISLISTFIILIKYIKVLCSKCKWKKKPH